MVQIKSPFPTAGSTPIIGQAGKRSAFFLTLHAVHRPLNSIAGLAPPSPPPPRLRGCDPAPLATSPGDTSDGSADFLPATVVYAGTPPAFVDAPRSAGMWQMFPRDDEAVKTIQDGRWRHPPTPVDWTVRPRYTAPLAVRRDPERGLAAVLMTQPEECLAVATPYDGEGHRSVYFSLFGRDLRPDETAATRARLRLGRELTNEQALELHQQFLRQNPTP